MIWNREVVQVRGRLGITPSVSESHFVMGDMDVECWAAAEAVAAAVSPSPSILKL